MSLRRGFKAEANWLARNVRDEQGIAADLRLHPQPKLLNGVERKLTP